MKRTPPKRKTSIKRTPGRLKTTPGRKKKSRAWKFVKTHLQECDEAFSREIRERDGRCLFPGCHVEEFAALQASHYIGRANWNTRFDPENMIALCWFHHFKSKDLGYEYQKQRKEVHGWDGQYTLFMRQFLGETRFNALLERANGKKSRKEAILETQKRYNLRQPVEPVDNSLQGEEQGIQ